VTEKGFMELTPGEYVSGASHMILMAARIDRPAALKLVEI
jgi:hypothetical protein